MINEYTPRCAHSSKQPAVWSGEISIAGGAVEVVPTRCSAISVSGGAECCAIFGQLCTSIKITARVSASQADTFIGDLKQNVNSVGVSSFSVGEYFH